MNNTTTLKGLEKKRTKLSFGKQYFDWILKGY